MPETTATDWPMDGVRDLQHMRQPIKWHFIISHNAAGRSQKASTARPHLLLSTPSAFPHSRPPKSMQLPHPSSLHLRAFTQMTASA